MEKNEDLIEEIVPLSEEEANEILEKYSPESNLRKFDGLPKFIMRLLCVGFTLFFLAANTGLLFLPPQIHRSLFMGLVIFLVFLLYPARPLFKKKGDDAEEGEDKRRSNYIPWFDLLFATIGAGTFLYFALNFESIARAQMMFEPYQLWIAVVGIAILFIACHRVMGLPLMIVAGVFLAYPFFGRFIPGQFGHGGFRFERVFTFLFYTTEGVIGIPIGVASTFIFVFMLFGAVMEKTGIGQFFIDISNAIAGKATGGPAKVAVIVSGLSGAVSGSSVANTVSTGSFTIPMMKRMGYEKNFAGAVEAAASTGGQIMPPILGAAAFLMVEITGIPYNEIALAAVIPATLYFVSIFFAVHFESRKLKLQGLPAEEIPKFLPLLLKKGQLMFGIVAIVVFLNMGFTPTMAALYAILVSIAVSMVRKDTRLTPKKTVEVLELGAKNTLSVAIACAMAGIIVGVVTMTGLGMAFANSMLNLTYVIGNETLRLILVLIACMFASLILGLGVPTTAKYVIMATIAAPILYRMGVPLIAAHFFVLFFGIDADITPPVGLAAYAAASISKGDPIKTGVQAVRLGIAAYLIPFIFVFNPQMLMYNTTFLEALPLFVTGIVGIIGIASGLTGYISTHLNKFERAGLLIGGLVLVHPSFITDVIGIVLVTIAVATQFIRSKKLATE